MRMTKQNASWKRTYPEWLKYTSNQKASYVQRKTKIPVPLMNRLRQGKPCNISAKTRRKLHNFYNKTWENKLKKSGVSLIERKKSVPVMSVHELHTLRIEYDRVARFIQRRKYRATGKKISLTHIKKGMGKSYRNIDDWILFQRMNLQSKKPKKYYNNDD